MKIRRVMENNSTSTEGNTNGMGNVRAPQPGPIPGQVNTLPSQTPPPPPVVEEENERRVQPFAAFLNEEGTAGATMGNTGGGNNVTIANPGPNNTGQVNSYTGNGSPTNAPGSKDGSGDSPKYYPTVLRGDKKKKHKINPKIVTHPKESHMNRGLGSDLEDKGTMYVTKWTDWNYPSTPFGTSKKEHKEYDEGYAEHKRQDDEQYLYALRDVAETVAKAYQNKVFKFQKLAPGLEGLISEELVKEFGTASESDLNWVKEYLTDKYAHEV